MARLVGVDLPREKRMEIALTYIFGIGRTRSKETLAATDIDPNMRLQDLTDEQLVKLRDWIEDKYQIEGDLRREVAADIRRKVEIGSYEGIRHRRGLPVRGQRTHTNARARKGPRKTVAGKKKVTDSSRMFRSPTASRNVRTDTPGDSYMPPKATDRRQEGAPQGKEERCPRARSHQEHVQQHDHLDHRPNRGGDRVGVRRPGRLQGLSQVDAVRCADDR